jgi:DNA-binding MarR family transcriptional regulator
LCKGISYSAGAMTRMIDRLEEKGLLRRSRDSGDRRLVNLNLTEKGNNAIPHMRESARRVLNRLLQGFTKVEVGRFEKLLTRMLENVPYEA